MKTWRAKLAVVAMSCVLAVGAAHAIPITVSFTVSGFGAGAPTDPVSGTFVYDAASATANINSLTSISLTIGGHAYTLAEVGFLSPFGPSQVIGGTVNGVQAVGAFTNDFLVSWNETTLVPGGFAYATASTSVFNGTFTAFSVTAASSVPEPATLALLGLGLAGLVTVRRRRIA